MNKFFLSFIFLCISADSAEAQLRARTKPDCIRVCNKHSGPPLVAERHEKKMQEIQAQKKTATDPEKIKLFEQAEADEVERFEDERNKFCEYICEGNPEN